MTTREKVDALLDQLSEPELEAEYARLLRERDLDEGIASAYRRTPQHKPDGWADLRSVNEASRDAVLERLDTEERAAGHKPW
ncbi:MAG: hypothetical protein JOZ98_22880 [Solirubrobacterales bacterium]|nr:hypothetical protein [Solirubrobacterales bacterium]MBV9798856.1 hypothetical protein [Solirubrobacterales bacterium]